MNRRGPLQLPLTPGEIKALKAVAKMAARDYRVQRDGPMDTSALLSNLIQMYRLLKIQKGEAPRTLAAFGHVYDLATKRRV